MIKVKVSTPFPQIPIARQTPGGKGIWGNYEFITEDSPEKADWWVVIDGLKNEETCICPEGNTLLVTFETEFTKIYNPKFLRQFGWVITSQQVIKHPRVIHKQQGHLWHVGWFGTGSGVDPKDFKKVFTTYDELKAIDTTKIPKEDALSIVISTKNRTEGQRLRLKFIHDLKKRLGEKFHLYGVGFNMVKNKWDGIAPYKYHIIIENSFAPDWWTEKLADCYLAGSYPIHFGCTNIHDYFSPEMLTTIDINKPEDAISTIEKVMRENYYEKRQEKIQEARELIMNKYNIFAMLAETLNTLETGKEKVKVTLKPESKPRLIAKVVSSLKNAPLIYKTSKKIYRAWRKARYGEEKI